MRKSYLFTACTLCLVLLFAAASMAVERPVKIQPGDELLPVLLTNPTGPRNPARDQEDDFWTFRFRVSTDGGENWSDLHGAGDTGMWEVDVMGDTVSVVIGWTTGMGTVVDLDNNIHFVAVLNGFNPDINPLARENGVYDVMVSPDGENSTFTPIVVEDELSNFVYADCGIDADGNLYAIWHRQVLDEEGAPVEGEIWAARTTEGEWGDGIPVVDELDIGDNYPHMTPTVGDYFYVLYQIPNAETGLYDQYIARVPASLEGDVIISEAVASSGSDVSYYVSDVNPIDQDVDAGFVYFCIRSEDLGGITVGNSDNMGESWTVETVAGAQRYPSIGLDKANAIPWLFSNFAVSAPHWNWIAHDDIGYNGGDWVGPDTLTEIAPGEVLYVHLGVWTSEGRFISGCNIWNYPTPTITPSRFITRYSDDGGDNWSDPLQTFSIWDDVIEGHYITGVNIVAGHNNYVFTALAGRYGVTDVIPPVCITVSVSSFMLDEPKVVEVEMTDGSGIDFEGDGAMFNWIKVAEGYDWVCVNQDSMDTDPLGSGTYWFHLPDSAADGDGNMQPLAPGDTVLFYADAYDNNGNYGAEHDGEYSNVWIVNESITEVPGDAEELPLNFELGSNYPNPFNNSTVIPFSLERAMDVRIAVYDLSGRLVATLFEGRAEAGHNEVAWMGEGATSGIYFYTFEAAGSRIINKMTLLR